MIKFHRLSSVARAVAGLLAGAVALGVAAPVLACGGGGSGAYRKPARPVAHHHAPQPGAETSPEPAKDPSAGS